MVFEVSQDEAGPRSSDLGCRQSYEACLLLSKATVVPLACMRDVSVFVACYLNSESIISAVESENGLWKPYSANRRTVVIGKFQEWKLKYPEVTFEPLQHIASPLNHIDLPTTCTVPDFGMNTLWQEGLSFLKLSRKEWPAPREFKSQIS